MGATSEIVTGVVIALDVFLLSRYDAVADIQYHHAHLCMAVEEHLHRAKGKAAVSSFILPDTLLPLESSEILSSVACNGSAGNSWTGIAL